MSQDKNNTKSIMAPQAAHANLPTAVAEGRREPDAALATDDQDALMLDLDRLRVPQDSLPIGTDNDTTHAVEASRFEIDAIQEDALVADATVNSAEHLPQREVEDDWVLVGDAPETIDQAESLVGVGSWTEN